MYRRTPGIRNAPTGWNSGDTRKWPRHSNRTDYTPQTIVANARRRARFRATMVGDGMLGRDCRPPQEGGAQKHAAGGVNRGGLAGYGSKEAPAWLDERKNKETQRKKQKKQQNKGDNRAGGVSGGGFLPAAALTGFVSARRLFSLHLLDIFMNILSCPGIGLMQRIDSSC